MGAAASGVTGWLASWFRPTVDGAATGPPNPITGLTPAQVKAVQRTFLIARPSIKEFGVAMFVELFAAHPEYQKYFKSFAGVPQKKLPQDKKFIAHATTVAYSVQNIVDNLDDPECLLELLFKVGCNHGRRGVEPITFQNLRNVIVGMLKKNLGKKFTEFDEEAWFKTLDVANSVIFKGLAEGNLEMPKPSS